MPPPNLAPLGWPVSPHGLGTCVEPKRDVEERRQLPLCPAGSIHYLGKGQPYIADNHFLWMAEVG